MGIAILDPTNQLEGRLAFSRTVRLRTDNDNQIKFWIFAETWRPCRHCGQFFGKLSSQQNRKVWCQIGARVLCAIWCEEKT